MKTLKEYIQKVNKEEAYEFYAKIIKNRKEYEDVTRNDIYKNIISLYKKNPEIILDLCNAEEINILKAYINELTVSNKGYIEYLLFENLRKNYLLLQENNNYYIPSDILNYIKMAINLLEEEKFSFKDVLDSVIIGITRIYNTITLEELESLLEEYHVKFKMDIKKYIKDNPKFYHVLEVIKIKGIYYLVSIEHYYYKDIVNIKVKEIPLKKYTLEEVISFGKYKINLFDSHIFEYLNFLEAHLESKYVDLILTDLMIYMGFDLNNDDILKNITDNIEELYQETKKGINYFPIWIYQGHSLNSLKDIEK